MFVYEVGPIDHWNGWTPYEDYQKKWSPREREPGCGEALLYIEEAADAFKQAEDLAARFLSWEGDSEGGRYVSGLPSPGDDAHSCLIVAWKQKNDGTTFIGSCLPLPWLAGSGRKIAHSGLLNEKGPYFELANG